MAMEVGATAPTQASHRLSGILVAVGDSSLQIAVKGEIDVNRMRQVSTDGNTKYMKWVTPQPWQQDTRASREFLVVGRCVEVQLRSEKSDVADLVRVSAEPGTGVFDPCKSLR